MKNGKESIILIICLQSETPSSIYSLTISELSHSCNRNQSVHRKPMSMQHNLPGSHFFLEPHDKQGQHFIAFLLQT